MNRIHPLGSRVLVLHRPQEKVTKGGILLPDFKPGATPTEYGTVVEAGPDAGEELTEGTEVVFHRHAGATLELDGQQYQLLLAEGIMATVDATPDEEPSLSETLENMLEGNE